MRGWQQSGPFWSSEEEKEEAQAEEGKKETIDFHLGLERLLK